MSNKNTEKKTFMGFIRDTDSVVKFILSMITLLTIIFGFIWAIQENNRRIDTKFEQLMEEIKVVEMQALKNTIYNENIPKHERYSACDKYINHGYNSYTREFCKMLLSEVH